jgi:hypothetical protein
MVHIPVDVGKLLYLLGRRCSPRTGHVELLAVTNVEHILLR